MTSENEQASSLTAASDDLLTAAARGGDESAMGMLYERYRRPLYAYLNRMLNNDTMTADDLFQDLWIKVFKKLPDYKEEGVFLRGFSVWRAIRCWSISGAKRAAQKSGV